MGFMDQFKKITGYNNGEDDYGSDNDYSDYIPRP